MADGEVIDGEVADGEEVPSCNDSGMLLDEAEVGLGQEASLEPPTV